LRRSGGRPRIETSLAEGAGIHRIDIATPFGTGAVNAYLIQDDPLTLVDTGPNSGTSLDAIQRTLAKLGRRVEDLGLIIITHQHLDHLGLASLLANASGADVAALDALVPWAADLASSMEAEDEYAEQMMTRHGVPRDVRSTLRTITQAYRGWGASMKVTVPLTDNETVTLRDRRLVIHHRPGHSPSDIVLHDPHSGSLFAGDHLLPETGWNSLLARPLSEEHDIDHRPSALITYIASLERSRAMELDFVLPGHGAPFSDHPELIDMRLAEWRRRATRLHSVLLEGPRNAYDIAMSVWGSVPVIHAYHRLAAVLGPLDLLIADGAVHQTVADDGSTSFAAAKI
jgi:glyoxylase-like metal-dependent hydrolase (beta-lactamase superfamily II)